MMLLLLVAARERLRLRRRATCPRPCTDWMDRWSGMLAGGRHATHGRPCGRTSVTHFWALARIYGINLVL
jgi:hypothetical protein